MTTPLERVTAALAEHFRLERELGQGGMATVYLAEDIKHHRKVAVKVLRPELAASLGPDRFFREIEVAAQLQHPHILPLFDSGASGQGAAGGAEFLWYAMPYVDGETLRDRLGRTGELPVHDAIRILIEVADALAHAHKHGVAHRDIKPENILLSGRHALVSDFGVAKAVSEATGRQQLTTAGVALGTPAYMAPEQAAADPHLDHRVDIYALGVLGYELLTGRTPFSGRTPQETLAAHVLQAPEAISRIRPGISPALEAIVMKCLAKRPADRFQTAEELVVALEPLATPSGGMTPTHTQPVQATTATPTGRKRGGAMVLTAVVAAVVIAAVLMFRRGAGVPDLVLSTTTRLTSAPGLEALPSLSPDGRFLAYVAMSRLTAEIFLQPTDGGRALNITDSIPGAQISPDWSPDGRRLVFASYDSAGASIVTMPPTGGDMRRLYQVGYDGGRPLAPKWSPDGARIAFEQDDSILVMRADGSNLTLLARVVDVHSLAWSPDGRWLAGVRGNADFAYSGPGFGNFAASTVFVIPAKGGVPVMVSDSTTLNVSPVWLPGADALLYLSSSGGGRDIYSQRIGRRGEAVGRPRRITTGLDAHSIALSRDGKELAYTKYTRDLNIWMVRIPKLGSADAGTAAPITRGNQASEIMRLSPDGKWLAYDSDLNGNADIFIVPTEGGTPRQLTDSPSDDLAPDWSPDGSTLSFHSFRTGNRDIFTINVDGTGLTQVTADTLSDWYAIWGPDNNTLAFSRGEYTNQALLEIRRPSPTAPWGTPIRLAASYASGATRDRTAYLQADPDHLKTILAIPSSGGEPKRIAEFPDAQFVFWPRMSPGQSTLFVFLVEANGAPGFWAVDLASGAKRQIVRFGATDPRTLRGPFDTDGKRLYFATGEHQGDIWVAKVEAR